MFDNLSEKLQRVFKNLRREGKLTAENIEAALRENPRGAPEADVHFKVVKQFIEAIKAKAMGEGVLTALSPSYFLITWLPFYPVRERHFSMDSRTGRTGEKGRRGT